MERGNEKKKKNTKVNTKSQLAGKQYESRSWNLAKRYTWENNTRNRYCPHLSSLNHLSIDRRGGRKNENLFIYSPNAILSVTHRMEQVKWRMHLDRVLKKCPSRVFFLYVVRTIKYRCTCFITWFEIGVTRVHSFRMKHPQQ